MRCLTCCCTYYTSHDRIDSLTCQSCQPDTLCSLFGVMVEIDLKCILLSAVI